MTNECEPDKCDSWAVAAIYLLENSKGHYRSALTEFIRNSGITTLGKKSKTSHQTLKTILLTKKLFGDNVFKKEGGGYYSLNNKEKIAKHEEVLTARKLLEQKQAEMSSKEIKEQNERLLKENQRLKEKLKSIKQICDQI